MEELHSWVENNIKIIKCLIERNKKYFDYPFTSNTAHYYKLMLLHKEMECLMSFSDFLKGLGLHRGQLKDKKSSYFEIVMKNERKQLPGFITLKTENEILEYMKQLEWKIDELQSINMKSQVQ